MAPVYARRLSTRRSAAIARTRARASRWSRRTRFLPADDVHQEDGASSSISGGTGGSSPARTPVASAMPSSRRTAPSLRS
jgi:hypothetical protein